MRLIEVCGDTRDVDGLIESVKSKFSVSPFQSLDATDQLDAAVLYQDDSDAMAHAFNRGLAMYVLGFVDSKVDGTLQVIENKEE